MKTNRCFLPALFLAVLAALPAAAPAQGKAARIDGLIAAYNEIGSFNGAALVAEKGEVVLEKGYGLANIEWDIPNAPDTKFRIGSITKQFTAMLIMQLVEQGRIQRDGKITEYLPGYRRDTGDRITIHHLLTHTSGIPSYTGLPEYQDIARDPYDVDEFVQQYCSGDLEFEPGSQYRYNNSGYFLLGAVIEKVTGKTYETVLQENICDRIGMRSTGYERHATILPGRAVGYTATLDGYENSEYLDMTLPYAAGAMYSTVEDMLLWDRALYTDALLSDEYRKFLFEEHQPIGGTSYGYGWFIRDDGDFGKEISHGGGINGFNTLIVRLVEEECLIVLFNNTPGANLASMARKITSILHDRPADPPRPLLSRMLYDRMKTRGIDAAIALYRALKKTDPDAYDFGERVLNRFGYRLLRVGRIDEAIAFFTLNTEEYPESADVYDSIGEAYAAKGEKALAVRNYEKSLQIDPENAGAIQAIERLIEP